MRRWKSQIALLLIGAMAVNGVAPAGGITSLAAKSFLEVGYREMSGEKSTPSNADEAASLGEEEATPLEEEETTASREEEATPSGEEEATPLEEEETTASMEEEATPSGVEATPSEAEEATPSEAKLAAPIELVSKTFGAEAFVEYISDMELEDAHADWGKWLKDRTVGGSEDTDGGPLQLNLPGKGKRNFPKGLAANSKAYATIDVSEYQGQYFFAFAGVEAGSNGSCTFEVLTSEDGSTWVTQWKSSRVMKGNDDAEKVSFQIPNNAQKLKLVIGDGGNGNNSDHGIWANALIAADEDAIDTTVYLDVSAPSYLKIGQEQSLSVMAYTLDGEAISNEDLNVISDKEDVVTAERKSSLWKLTGIGDGVAQVIVTVGEDRVTEEFMVTVGEGDESTWRVNSPDGNQSLMFFMNKDKGVDYIALKNGEAVIEQSSTGIRTDAGDFTFGLTLESLKVEKIKDSYDLIGAKTASVENEAEEITLSFTKNEAEYAIVARVYDDGFALRYKIPGVGEAKAVKIMEEYTRFVLPQDSIAYAMKYAVAHEEVPFKKTLSQLNERYSMPLLYQIKENTWGLISEAAMNGSYCGAMLKGDGNGVVDVKFAPEQNGAVVADLPFESPWRFAVVGDAKTINENTMAENLSPECQLLDTSWIEPGVTAWTWLNGDATGDFETYKRYIDLAAEMGWKYVLMDEGWQPGGRSNDSQYWETDDKGRYYRKFYDWTDELIKYADDKGVGLLAWAHSNDFNTAQDMRTLEIWAEKGIKGIKIDFFDSQDQRTMKKYDDLMEKTAECHLLLNPHGANKPSGQRRTWPQTLAREGIFGAEQNQDPNRNQLITAAYHCLIPFIRNAVGPADYTPLLSYGNAKEVYTISQMAALSVIFECGIPCFADKPSAYMQSPAKSLLTSIPASWDESFMLEGEPGKYVSIARRNGANWYVGSICDEARDAEVDLSFLKAGTTYYAVIYKDGKTMSDIDLEMRTVTSDDVLKIPLAKAGGASIKITTEAPQQPESITLSKEQTTLMEGDSEVITAKLAPEGTTYGYVTWTSSNENVATVKDGKIKALKPGNAVITASTGLGVSVSASCNVTVTWPLVRLDKDRWTIRANNPDRWKLNSETSLTIIGDSGEFGTGGNPNAKNVFFMEAKGDFTASVKLDFEPESDYQSGGIVIYANDNAVQEVLRRHHSGQGGRVISTVRVQDNSYAEQPIKENGHTGEAIYLKVARQGKICTASYSYDNENWIQIGNSVENKAFDQADLKVGLYSVNGNGKPGDIPATFENFTFEQNGISSVIPFAKATDAELEQLKIDLAELIRLGKMYKEEIYTKSSFAVLKAAMDAAEGALTMEEKEILKECREAMEAAIDGLVTKEIDDLRAELRALADSCAGYKEDEYTESSFSVLKEALNAAKDALTAETSQKTLIDCYNALKEAIKGLVPKKEIELEKLKADLAGLIGSCVQYEENSYTKSSFAVLKAALTKAVEVLNDENSTKVEVASCYKNLLNAVRSLEKVKEHESTNDSGSKSESSYTPSSSASESKWIQDANGWWIRNKDGSYPKEQWASMIENGKTVWYYFDANGYMKDGWINVNGKTYFLHNVMDGTRGAMYTGWHIIEGKWYYFEEKEGSDQGKMLAGCVTPDGYRVDENGVWVQ